MRDCFEVNFKETFRAVLNRAGYDIRRFVARCGENINVLDLAVRCRLSVTDRFFLLQIGANDGKMDDPVCDLVKRHKLSGLLVEPVPEYFEQLRANYADQPQLTFENCAIATHNGEQELFRIRKGAYPNRPRVQGMAGFDRRALLRSKGLLPGVQRQIETIRVRTMTLDSLLEKHRIKHVDLLQVDTEGYDYEILKMLLRTAIRPNIIHYEHIHLTSREQVNCRQMLMPHGYRFASDSFDTLAARDV